GLLTAPRGPRLKAGAIDGALTQDPSPAPKGQPGTSPHEPPRFAWADRRRRSRAGAGPGRDSPALDVAILAGDAGKVSRPRKPLTALWDTMSLGGPASSLCRYVNALKEACYVRNGTAVRGCDQSS